MKNFVRILICTLSWSVYGQSGLFIRNAKILIEELDSTYTIQHAQASESEYDILSSGSEELESLFLSFLSKQVGERQDGIVQSRTLNALATLATEAWQGSQYSDSKKWRNLKKYFQRASEKSTARFNYLNAVSFRIKLVNNQGKRFYYDRKGSSGGLNLYTGKKVSNNSADDEDSESQVPLKYFTEKELVKRFEKELRRKTVITDLKRGSYSFVGLSVEIDENTLYKNRIPTARVVIVFGARRLQKVKVRYKPDK